MAARVEQDVILVIKQPTSSKARVAQDVLLTVNAVTSSKARVAQDVLLAVNAVTSSNARIAQDVLLVIAQNNLLRKLKPHHPIVVWRKKPRIKPRLGFLQNAALLAAQPFKPNPIPIMQVRTHRQQPRLKPRWGYLQNAALIAATPVGPPAVTAVPWAWVFTS